MNIAFIFSAFQFFDVIALPKYWMQIWSENLANSPAWHCMNKICVLAHLHTLLGSDYPKNYMHQCVQDCFPLALGA